MNTRSTLIISASLIILFFAAIFWFSGEGNDPTASITAEDWVRGAAKPTVELIEYGDFQCPACASYEPLLQQAQTEFKDTLRFAYRHFPLTRIHPNALLAARASEAAGAQGKFWEMHDLLFENQETWSGSTAAETLFTAYAKEIGLNMARFGEDLSADAAAKNVEDDYLEGLRLQVQGTPTFFLNGQKIDNPRNYEDLRSSITEATENRSLGGATTTGSGQ